MKGRKACSCVGKKECQLYDLLDKKRKRKPKQCLGFEKMCIYMYVCASVSIDDNSTHPY